LLDCSAPYDGRVSIGGSSTKKSSAAIVKQFTFAGPARLLISRCWGISGAQQVGAAGTRYFEPDGVCFLVTVQAAGGVPLAVLIELKRGALKE
jgi:hypothetical protein